MFCGERFVNDRQVAQYLALLLQLTEIYCAQLILNTNESRFAADAMSSVLAAFFPRILCLLVAILSSIALTRLIIGVMRCSTTELKSEMDVEMPEVVDVFDGVVALASTSARED